LYKGVLLKPQPKMPEKIVRSRWPEAEACLKSGLVMTLPSHEATVA
jgi:hypothetical protein